MFKGSARLGAVALAAVLTLAAATPAHADTFKGRVYQDLVDDMGMPFSNGRFDEGDMGVSGVDVELRDQDGELLATDTTDAEGFYEFVDLAEMPIVVGPPTLSVTITLTNLPLIQPAPPLVAQGTHQVDGGDPMPGVMPESRPMTPPVPVMGPGETPRDVCVPVVPQGGAEDDVVFTDDGNPPLPPWPVAGTVSRNIGRCDDEFNIGQDEIIPNRMVSLEILMPAGQVNPAPVMSNNLGEFSFEGILDPDLMSDYLLRLTAPDENGNPVSSMVMVRFFPEVAGLPAEMQHAPIRLFPECVLGSIAGTVTQQGSGAPVANRQIDLCRSTSTGNVPAGSVMTDADGNYDSGELEDGNYTIKVAGSTASTSRIISQAANLRDVDIAIPCPRDPCSGRGHIHELVVATDVFVGALPGSMAVSAALYRNCSARTALDIASIGYAGTTFPGPAQGMDGILTIQDVSVQNGFATVIVRIVADLGAFPSGAFLNNRRQLRVTVNGRWNRACQRFRCDCVSTGSHFGRYRVIGTWDWASWRDCTGADVNIPEPRRRRPPRRTRRHHSNKSDKSDKSGKSGRSGKSDKSGKSGRSGKSGKSGKSGRSDKSGKSGKSGRSDKSDKSKKSHKSDKSGRSHRSYKHSKSRSYKKRSWGKRRSWRCRRR